MNLKIKNTLISERSTKYLIINNCISYDFQTNMVFSNIVFNHSYKLFWMTNNLMITPEIFKLATNVIVTNYYKIIKDISNCVFEYYGTDDYCLDNSNYYYTNCLDDYYRILANTNMTNFYFKK